MAMETFEIIKKNRKYFAAKIGGAKCNIVIDENSEGLEVGSTVELDVEDLSTHNSYGTKLLYRLKFNAEEQINAGECQFRHFMYNKDLREKCHKLSGKWDSETKLWTFSDLVEDKVAELDELYNGELVNCEITFTEEVVGDAEPIYILGYVAAEATHRDSGAETGAGVALISGEITSGGSRANWKTIITEGTVMRMKLPRGLLDGFEGSGEYTITVMPSKKKTPPPAKPTQAQPLELQEEDCLPSEGSAVGLNEANEKLVPFGYRVEAAGAKWEVKQLLIKENGNVYLSLGVFDDLGGVLRQFVDEITFGQLVEPLGMNNAQLNDFFELGKNTIYKIKPRKATKIEKLAIQQLISQAI